MSKTESVWLTPSWEDVEPPYNQQPDGLIVPNPQAGEPRPLNNIGVPITLPAVGDEPRVGRYVIEPAESIGDAWARIVPGTRIVQVTHPGLASVLIGEAGYIHCDPPKTTTRKPAAAGKE
jgi:hypothetical protein